MCGHSLGEALPQVQLILEATLEGIELRTK